tara:strand:+ start:15371 stop:15775 length:405 start_codon:yes stop_codon:yes gene_type:complete
MPKSFSQYGPVIEPPEALPEYKILEREEKLLQKAERSLRTCKNTRDFRYRSSLNFAKEINDPNGDSTTWTPHLARAFEGIARTEHEYAGYLEKLVKWHEKRVEAAREAFKKAEKENWDNARESWVKSRMRDQGP